MRRVYSIREGDIASCRDAIRYATRHWGGALDLIVQERVDGKWDDADRQYVHSVDPDLVIVCGGSADEQIARVGYPQEETSAWVVTVRAHQWGDANAPFRVLPAYGEPVVAPTGADLWAAAAWGDATRSPLEMTFEELAALDQTPAADGAPWPMPTGRVVREALQGTTSIVATASDVHTRITEIGIEFPWVFVGIDGPNDIESVVWYWNVRAISGRRAKVVPIPLWASPEDLSVVTEQVAIYLNRDDSPTTDPEFVGHLYRRENLDKLHELIEAIVPGAVRFSGERFRQTWLGKEKRAGPPTYAVIKPSLPRFVLLTAESSEQHPVVAGRTVKLFLQRPTVAVDARANIAMDIVDYPPLVMPRHRQTAQLVHPNARASAAGFTWQVSAPMGEFAFTVPDDREVFTAILAGHGLKAEASSWGTAAQRALTVVGGLTGLSTLRDRIALSLIYALSNIDRTFAGQPQLEPQPALTMAELSDRLSPLGVRGKNDVAPALDLLVAGRLVFPGMKVRCSHCGTDEWRVVDDLRIDMVCQACRAPIRLRLRDLSAGDPELPWAYRINQSIVWPAGQGVIPGLLLLAKLAPRAQHRFRYLLGQRVTGALNCEVDAFLAIDRQLAVAEVKRGDSLVPREIERTLDIAARLGGVAYFATEADAWAPETLTALEAAAKAATKVLGVEEFTLATLLR
jgi:hypothetical protein